MTERRLNRKLTLEEAIRTADGAGGFSQAWVALGDLWAEVDPSRGRSAGRGDLSLAQSATAVIVRGAPQGAASRPKPDQRFREGPRLFRIVAVTEDDRDGRYLRCDTIEEAVP